jgi:hypothetical protein
MKILYIDHNDITKHVVLQDVMEHAVNKLKKKDSMTLSQIQSPHFPSQVFGLNSLLVPAISSYNDSVFCVGGSYEVERRWRAGYHGRDV